MGRFVLDRNPANYFAEIEQIAFSPAHMVPGIEASPDKMLQVGTTPTFLIMINIIDIVNENTEWS